MQIQTGARTIGVAFLASLYALASFTMVYFTARTTAIDPSDPTIRLERIARVKGSKFDSNAYEFFCDLCETHVLLGSKHCKYCNRCTLKFDHHCDWVNSDIGEANYREFVYSLLSVSAQLTIQIAALAVTI